MVNLLPNDTKPVMSYSGYDLIDTTPLPWDNASRMELREEFFLKPAPDEEFGGINIWEPGVDDLHTVEVSDLMVQEAGSIEKLAQALHIRPEEIIGAVQNHSRRTRFYTVRVPDGM